MLLYTIKSREEIFEAGDYGLSDAGEFISGEAGEDQNGVGSGEIEIKLQGRSFMVQPLPGGQMKITRIISTDPLDYLNPDWQPGAVLSIR